MEDLFENLSKWQASSHPQLADTKPEYLFHPEFATRYSKLHRLLWERIIRLHGTLLTLEQMRDFPFRMLYAPGDMSFWNLVTENFRDAACIMIHGLVNDDGSHAHTLQRFKNEIAKATWADEPMLALFRKTLASCRFDDSINGIAERIAQIRHHRVAHQLVDYGMGSLKGTMEGVSLEELRKLFDAAHTLFGTLSFGSAYVTLVGDLMPATVGGKPKPTCLESVLDAVLKDSYFVNQPEVRGKWWPMDRAHTDPEALELMNQLRTRVGKPPA